MQGFVVNKQTKSGSLSMGRIVISNQIESLAKIEKKK